MLNQQPAPLICIRQTRELVRLRSLITEAQPKVYPPEAADLPPANVDTEGVFYESQVNAMTSQQYEVNQEAISKALKTGKFVYDLSAGAR